MGVANELAGHFLRKAPSLNSCATANADVCPVLDIVTAINLCRLTELRTEIDLRQLSTFELLGLSCADKRPGNRNKGTIAEADTCSEQAANSWDKEETIAHDDHSSLWTTGTAETLLLKVIAT
jgi:hypothetical protein